jgi:DNA-binding FrmR family transcriptional regulator
LILLRVALSGVDLILPWGIIAFIMTSNKTKLIKRLKIIAGQVRGIEKMLEEDRYCIDIITQSFAVKEALSGIENAILENHLSTHVVEQMKSGHQGKAVKEILNLYKISKKK